MPAMPFKGISDATTAAAAPPPPVALPAPVDATPPAAASPRAVRWKLALVVLLAAVMATLVVAHVRGVNGPHYWTWSWRRLPAWPLYALMLCAAAPFAAAQWLHARGAGIKRCLALVAASTLLLQVAAMWVQPPGHLRRMVDAVESANVNYFADAKVLAEQPNIPATDWLSQYPQVLPLLHIHARYKPPGLLLYYYGLIQLLGTGHAAAAAGGAIMALLAALGGPATYAMLRQLGCGRDGAFCGAAFMAITPSLVLFWPQFDQAYVSIACGLVGLWAAALNAKRLGRGVLLAAAFGLLLALASFASYTLLTLGVVLALQTILHVGDTRGRGTAWAMGACGAAFASVGIAYLLLWAITGFDPVATYVQITTSLGHDMVGLARPFPRHIPFDLLDYALGLGWVGALLAAMAIAAMGRGVWRIFSHGPVERVTFLALLQLLAIAFTGLLPGETARTWMIYMPLMMAAIGAELSGWPARARWVAYGCLWVIGVVICQNMTFIYMGPEFDGPRW